MLCFRGTSVYMAPEILIKSRRLDAASFENLKKVDVWAFGMVMFNLVNVPEKCTSLDPASRPSTSEISDEFIELLVKQTEDANCILLPRVEEWLVWFYRHINVKNKFHLTVNIFVSVHRYIFHFYVS